MITKPKKKTIRKSRNPAIDSLDSIAERMYHHVTVILNLNKVQGSFYGFLVKGRGEWVLKIDKDDSEIRFKEKDVKMIWFEEKRYRIYITIE